VGEQAEVFDHQMDVDKQWFESSPDAFYFRPEIEGEFDEYLVAGGEAPCIYAERDTPWGRERLPLGWVCVVDIGRYVDKSKEPSGWRCRIRTSPPKTGEIRKMLSDSVLEAVDNFIQALRDRGASHASYT